MSVAQRPDISWMRTGFPFNVLGEDYSPDGQTLAVVEDGFTQIKLLRASDGLLLRTYPLPCLYTPGSQGYGKRVDFARDGEHVFFRCVQNNLYSIRRLRLSDGVVDVTYGSEPSGGGQASANFMEMPDGTVAVGPQAALNNSTIKFYNYADGSFVRQLQNVTAVVSGQTVNWGAIDNGASFSEGGLISVGVLRGTGQAILMDANGMLIAYQSTGSLTRGPFPYISPDGTLVHSFINPGGYTRIGTGCGIGEVPPCHNLANAFNISGAGAFSPDNNFIATWLDSTADSVSFNRTTDGSLIRSTEAFTPQDIAVASDSQSVVVEERPTTFTQSLRVIPFAAGPTTRLESHYARLTNVAFSPAGNIVASVSANSPESVFSGENIIRLWNVADGSFLRSISTGQSSGSASDLNRLIAFSQDGQVVFHGTPTGVIQKWRVSDGTLAGTIPTAGTRGIAVSPDGQILASIINGTYEIGLYRVSDGGLVRTIPIPFPPPPPPGIYSTFSIAFSNDGQTLVAAQAFTNAQSGEFRGYLSFFNVSTGAWIRSVQTTSPRPNAIAVSPDGMSIAIAGYGVCGCSGGTLPTTGLAELRRMTDGSLIRNLTEHEGTDLGVVISPDGSKFVTTGIEPRIRFWNLNDGSPAVTFDQEVAVRTQAPVFSPTGAKFAYGRDDATLVVANNPFGGTPTPTPTSTPTSTPTATNTPTNTPTATPTGTPSGSADFDYDGDGKTDISIFRPLNGAWYLQRSRDGLYGTEFGYSTDKITPADYDGDGKADIAVYRPSDGIWYIFQSSTGTVDYRVFGIAEDLPTPADYDGDGHADISVFRPSTATWYRQNSSNGTFYARQFGTSEDKPTVGDFDGDGHADFAIFRPSLGDWYQLYSSDESVHGARFGFGTDVIVPADWDGDGRTDIAVYRPSDGIWYLTHSSNGTYDYKVFGLTTDIPAVGDFDGDGTADISVFRPSDGTWYRQNSSDGSFVAFPFGTNGDKPTQTAFRY